MKLYNFLITGTSGYIGKILKKKFTKTNYNIITISNYNEKKYKNILHIKKNILSKEILANKKVSTVVHMASKNIYTEKIYNYEKFIKSNIKTTISLAEYAKNNNIKKFIFFSSLAIYGKSNLKVIDNNSSYFDIDFYGLTKLLSESILKGYSKYFSVYILRIPGVIDENQNVPWPWLNEISKNIKNNKEKINIYNPYKKFNSLTNVDDIFKIIKSIHKKKEKNCYKIFNFGGNKPVNLINCLNLIKKYYKSKSAFKVLHNDKNSSLIKNSYIERDLNIKLSNTKDIIQYYLQKN
jgi:nucleoside-diphosphate-sugar epimerase